jgi:hypothetical protein
MMDVLAMLCSECDGLLMAITPRAQVITDMLEEIYDALGEGHFLVDYSKTMIEHADFCSCGEEAQDE